MVQRESFRTKRLSFSPHRDVRVRLLDDVVLQRCRSSALSREQGSKFRCLADYDLHRRQHRYVA